MAWMDLWEWDVRLEENDWAMWRCKNEWEWQWCIPTYKWDVYSEYIRLFTLNITKNKCKSKLIIDLTI